MRIWKRRPDRRGFTLVELAIVLMITAILVGVAVPNLTSAFHQRDVDGVRNGVMLLAARARALAMEQSMTVMFQLDADNDRARILRDGEVVELYDFEDEHGVTADAASNVVLCYTPRGFAVEPCSTSLPAPLEVEFSRSGRTSSLEIWQLGQLRKL